MLRTGTLDDAPAMAEIFNHYVATSTVIFSNDRLSAGDMRRRMEAIVGHMPFFVVESGGVVAGYCYCHLWHADPVYSQTLEVTIYLRDGYTGHGFGRQLLEAVIADSRSRGAHALISCITAGNEACERLHRSVGFRLAGLYREVGYKFGQYLDDAVYQLML